MRRFTISPPLVGMALALAAGAAMAQQAPGSATEQQGASQGESEPLLKEVVVVAEKREENIQVVPESLTYVSPVQLSLQNITTTAGLVNAAPSLTVTSEGAFQIRSIGTQGFGRSAEQSVSFVVDGVVVGRPLAYTMGDALYDVDHVEVLPGPQGTLFGNNADSGVILIVTKAPELGEYELKAHADLANHDYVNSYLIANAPIGQDAALRISFHHDTTGDVVYNTLYHEWDHNSDDGVRARLLWQPSDGLTFNLEADYQDVGSNGVNGIADFAGVAVFSYVPPGSPLAATLAGCGIVASPTNNRVCGNSLYAPGVNPGKTYGAERGGASLQIDYRVGRYQLTSITAARKDDTEDFAVHADLAGAFGDTLPQNILDRNLVPSEVQTVSQELRVASPAEDQLNFVAGLYYGSTASKDEIDQTGQLGVPLGTLEFRRFNTVESTLRNYAAYGQVNFRATNSLTAFLGARVTRDNLSDYSFNQFPDAFPPGPYIYTANTGFFSLFPINTCTVAGGNPDQPSTCPPGTSLTAPAKLSTTGETVKAGLKYAISSKSMGYATVALGYKGPFLNDQASYPILASQLTVKSEHPLDFELGVKSTLLGRFAVDGSVFWDKIRNFQTTEYVPPNGVDLVSSYIQGNAPYALTQGVQVDVFGDLSKQLSMTANLIYDDAHFNSGFLVQCASGPCPAISQMPYAPVWKGTLTGDYHRHVADGIQAFLQSDFVFSGRYPYGSSPGDPYSGARYLLGARLGIRSDDGRWGIAVFCKNCFDKRYPVQAGPDGFAAIDGGAGTAATGPAQVQYLTIDSYRLVGASLDVKF